MKKKAIITGILGQDGPYLAKFLLEKNYDVYGIMQRYSNPNLENLKFLGIESKINLITGDITDDGNMSHIIKNIKPEEFYNLAAQSFVGASWELSKITTEINACGVLNILNSIKNNSSSTKFYQASTSEMYGNSKESLLDENTPFCPQSPYAISKLYAYWITKNYRESYSLFTSNGILFNHESPLRGKEFVTRKITDAVARIKLGLQDSILLGNIDSVRDWGFAGDYVEAMWLMLQQDTPDDYVISTGETHSIKELLIIAFNHVGIEKWEKYINIDSRFVRPLDVKKLHGCSKKAKEKLNWTPKTSFKKLIEMMVDADLKRLQQK
jgi:GDPmannose 4,6-dehydratase